MLPSPSEHSDDSAIRKRPGVGFPRKPQVPRGLPSTRSLPPVTNPTEPAFHPGYHSSWVARRYPSLDELQDKSMREHPSLFAAAQWFSSVGVRDVADIEHSFADGAGMLPGQLPLQAIRTFDWRARIAIPTSVLRHSSPRGHCTLSLRFIDTVLARLDLHLTDALIPPSFGCDTWKFRTEGEHEYLDNLLSWTRGDPVLEADRLWHNQLTVTNDAM